MKIYSATDAGQQIQEILEQADREEVVIRRADGASYAVVPWSRLTSPFDVPGIQTRASTEDILEAIRESRAHQPGGGDR